MTSSPRVVPSLLGVFGHPDDESLLAGGVLAQLAAGHARTAVVTMTWAPGSPRATELADALRVLGAGVPRMLGYGDARHPHAAPGRPRLVDAPLEEVTAALVRQIRSLRPDIVVTHDAVGQPSVHPDHRYTHQVTLLAVNAAGHGQLYPDTGPLWQPAALYLATHPDSGTGNLGELLRRASKSVLSVPDGLVSATVDVRPWMACKWAAILAHRSQVERERPLPGILSRLPEEIRHRVIDTEYYTLISLVQSPGMTRLAT
ncbi:MULTISPECIES: PIG-L deacetylase family protein [unclassified Streptomyces]|uniref:PIG-L deacetylase family protein n=1 Tax=unclassified Streptomyces TaxID=2593676 RepID=UPI000FB701D9|nr:MULTISPECIES: PIG-L deacetylase family protein [unclassified Streptomyces]WSG55196.1 PIG-L family deacetylase [Streptomyces sp. NBC_01732]WSX05910.1 PIG-L family deacetylase [Streptomyces sp. NBC_00987]MCX4391826.1 PIG-L family deacetylase [Streptomyces sp. NBC_01767]MCX5103950.1 PIG-L family deacetylase [Streptomyces sp. NBC_00439]RPK67162.1 Mycothiol S-conjugate amidase [Streptomyces sp. ADI95-17]